MYRVQPLASSWMLTLAAFSQMALAQGADTIRQMDSPALVRLSSQLSKHRVVRVHGQFGTLLLDNPRLRGDTIEFVKARPPSGSLGVDATRVGLSEIRRIEVRGSAAGRGAKYGAVTLGSIGLLLGIVASTCDPSPDDFFCGRATPREKVVGTLAVTAGGALLGAALGGIIGSPFKRWKAVYRSP